MHEEPNGVGLLSGDAFPAAEDERDPLTAVRAVAEPRLEAAEGGSPAAGAEAPPDSGVVPDRNPADGNDYGEFAWPDGYTADPRALARFTPIARKLGLPKEGAQELANLYAELDQERSRAQTEFIARNNAEWLQEIRSHPEFGGHNLERAGEAVAGVLRRYGSPLLTAQIRQMNIQNWPEMFYFLARVSQAMSEDCSPSGIGRAAPPKSTAQLLFPGLK